MIFLFNDSQRNDTYWLQYINSELLFRPYSCFKLQYMLRFIDQCTTASFYVCNNVFHRLDAARTSSFKNIRIETVNELLSNLCSSEEFLKMLMIVKTSIRRLQLTNCQFYALHNYTVFILNIVKRTPYLTSLKI